MNEEEIKLRSVVDRFLARIKSGKSNAGDEHAYAIAYQDLVRAGYAMQIKKKYRGR